MEKELSDSISDSASGMESSGVPVQVTPVVGDFKFEVSSIVVMGVYELRALDCGLIDSFGSDGALNLFGMVIVCED